MLGLVLPPLLVALVLVLFGRSNQPALAVRWWPLAAVALGLQVVLFNHPLDQQPWALAWGALIYGVSMLVVTGVLLANGVRLGPAGWPWLVAALGVALNMLVVTANGGYMPQSADAREAAGRVSDRPDSTAIPHLTNVRPMRPDSQLPWLGDVFPEPAWFPMANVISVGDLLLSLGVASALLPIGALRRR